MPATRNQTAEKLTAAAVKVLKSFAGPIAEAVAALGDVERAAVAATNALGRVLRDSVREGLKVYGDEPGELATELVQAEILAMLAIAGRPMEWERVNALVTAANTVETFPEDVQGVFSTDAILAFRGLKTKDEKTGKVRPATVAERAAFASSLADVGVTDIRGVRAAKNEHNEAEGAPKGKTTEASRTSSLEKKLEGSSRLLAIMETAQSLDLLTLADGSPNDTGITFMHAVAMYGVVVGQNGNEPKSRHYARAIESTISFPVESDEDDS